MKTFVPAALAVLMLVAFPALGEERSRADSVRILDVLPQEPVERGVEVELTIDVEAILESDYEGVAMVGFNTTSPVQFAMVDSHELASGAQRFTFVVKVVPVDWDERGDFEVLVNIGPKVAGARWHPTASDRRTIEVRP